MERLWPHSPAPLVAVGGSIAASWFFGLHAQGVSTVGLIPQGFPSLTLPDVALIEQLLPGAFGIALMSFTESIAAGRAFARSTEPPINANRELIAIGAANLGGALFGAMPAGGGTTQTAVVRAAGGQVAEGVAGDGGHCGGDHAAACAVAGLAAIRHARGGGHRLFGRTDPACGVPRHQQSAQDGVLLGCRGLFRCADIWHAAGHRSGDHRIGDRTNEPGQQPARVYHRP